MLTLPALERMTVKELKSLARSRGLRAPLHYPEIKLSWIYLLLGQRR